jgi:hypothetical protein
MFRRPSKSGKNFFWKLGHLQIGLPTDLSWICLERVWRQQDTVSQGLDAFHQVIRMGTVHLKK